MTTKAKIPQNVLGALKFALSNADMDKARCCVEDEHKQAMRLYLNTYVKGPLKEVLEWAEGERSSRSIIRR